MITSSTVEQILAKGNVWYIRHYEGYFNRVYAVYPFGNPHKPVTNGKTTLVSVGTGRGPKTDLIMAPYRLYKLAKEIRPSSYLTADIVYSWWVCLFLRTLLRARILLMPVCIPEQIYEATRKSTSGLPMWLERLFVKLSFTLSYRVMTGKNISVFVAWLSSIRTVRSKLLIVDTLVDELPSIEFYNRLEERAVHQHSKVFNLLYVGRLDKEKMVADLIEMLALIKREHANVRLTLVGDGPERHNLEELAIRKGVRNEADFVGSKKSGDLVNYYKNAEVFVSPLTGTALREAALCERAVVAYNMDWVRGFLVDEENALLAEAGNVKKLAEQVTRLLTDENLRKTIAQRLHKVALEYWRPERVRIALEQAFASD
ncbi:MAG: glycosyltransferase [Candidatus Bathyarchaeia archaeon]